MAKKVLKVTTQSPSKIILTGENAVIFGASSVACAVDLKNHCVINTWENQFFRISINSNIVEFNKKNCIKLYNEIEALYSSNKLSKISSISQGRAYNWIQYVFGLLMEKNIELPLFCANISLGAPLGSGIGGSATTTVLILKAISQLIGWELSPNSLYQLAFKGDKIAHGGRASGTDCGAIVYGCCISHRLKNEFRLIKMKSSLRFLLCSSGEEKNNANSLAKFYKLKSENPNGFSNDIAEFEDISMQMMKLLENSLDIQAIGELMNKNQILLTKYGLNSHQIDTIIQIGLDSGAYGAKLTGGGGGGSIIMIAADGIYKNIISKLNDFGKKSFIVNTLNCKY